MQADALMQHADGVTQSVRAMCVLYLVCFIPGSALPNESDGFVNPACYCYTLA